MRSYLGTMDAGRPLKRESCFKPHYFACLVASLCCWLPSNTNLGKFKQSSRAIKKAITAQPDDIGCQAEGKPVGSALQTPPPVHHPMSLPRTYMALHTQTLYAMGRYGLYGPLLVSQRSPQYTELSAYYITYIYTSISSFYDPFRVRVNAAHITPARRQAGCC